eukprot:4476165-Ditylum_brightwellii.AAC.1
MKARRLNELRTQLCRTESAMIIQSHIRRFLAICLIKRTRDEIADQKHIEYVRCYIRKNKCQLFSDACKNASSCNRGQ